MKQHTGLCQELVPGAPLQEVPKEVDQEPPEGFIDNTVKVYKMNPDGSKGEHIKDMPAYPEGWNDPANFKRPVGRRVKKEEDNMAQGIVDWNIIWPKVEAILEKDPNRSPADIAKELGIPAGPLYPKIKYEREKKLKQQQTQSSEPEKVGRQDPVQSNAEPAVEKSMTEEPAEVKPEEFTPADEKPIEFVPAEINWPEVLPKAAALKAKGLTWAEVAAELNISLSTLRHKVDRERQKNKKDAVKQADVLPTLKVGWIKDIIFEDELNPELQLNLIEKINSL